MPYCSVLQCKNDSRRTNINNGGVSYHRFPKDAAIKELWIDATGRVNWMPTKFSTICSEHFLDIDFLKSGKGLRYLKSTVVPTLKTFKYLNQQLNCIGVTEGSSKRRGDSDSSDLTQSKKDSRLHKDSVAQTQVVMVCIQLHCVSSVIQSEKESITIIYAAAGSTTSTPKKKKLGRQLKFCERNIKK